MTEQTRAKAQRASEIAGELYRLLGELQSELSGSDRGDFAGYLLVTDVRERVFGRKSEEDVLAKLHAVATMGKQ